jgi:hypothetical protein
MNVVLTQEERQVFAALARVLVRIDGQLSRAERRALETVTGQLLTAMPSEGPYREMPAPAPPADPAAVWALLERAELEDDEAVRRAARTVTREPAREIIYEALHEIAAIDAIAKPEWGVLEWLAKEWGR